MPAFPDKESSLLNKLYETAPWTAKLHGLAPEAGAPQPPHQQQQQQQEPDGGAPQPVVNGVAEPVMSTAQAGEEALINTGEC